MKVSYRLDAKTAQIQSNGLPLRHEPVSLDPGFAIGPAGAKTHSPDTSLTFLHYHDSMEIGYCYEGSGVFIVDGNIHPFSAGCASVILANEIHIARSSPEQGSKWKFVNLDPALLLGRAFPEAAWLYEPGARGIPGIVPPDDPSGLAAAVRSLLDELPRRDAASEFAVKGLALCMLAKLSRLGADLARGRKPQPKGDIGSISKAVDIIVRGYTQPVRIPELAAACGMSEATFRRRFARCMGMSPGDYVHNLRIQMAGLRLLSSRDRVLDIALAAGYDSISAFNRHFRRIFGAAPREYRGRGFPGGE